MSYFLKEKFTDEEISKFLGVDEDYVKRHRSIASNMCRKILATRLSNRKLFAKREMTKQLILSKGMVSVHELEQAGISRESLWQKPAILGCGEEDEDYEERFVRHNFPDNVADEEEPVRGEGNLDNGSREDLPEEVYNEDYEEQGSSEDRQESYGLPNNF